ncbi:MULTISPECIES: DUF4260 domain-containing protein [unclassified Brevundimonas]|uniref:DUF4260 domain-containing protein n=1 Tax=unclassified Brevundimonas TaxID=2622653 RepID=UPI0025B7C976|nr:MULTISPECIES: DUF4260 domain-containing protein [unclassified Brevundimonas]
MFVAGGWQRTEGGVLLVAATLAFFRLDGSWLLYLGLFLVPDLSMAAYAVGPRTGAVVYNLAHSLILPLVLMGAGFAFAAQWAVLAGLVWLAHIGFDRMLGYGLKSAQAFGITHLGMIGKARHQTL